MKKSILSIIPKGVSRIGLTSIRRDFLNSPTFGRGVRISISHSGNMGNTKKDVEENLFRLFGLKFSDLDNHPLRIWTEENGSPDYFYTRDYLFSHTKQKPVYLTKK